METGYFGDYHSGMIYCTLKKVAARAIAALVLFAAFGMGAQAATVNVFPTSGCFTGSTSCTAIDEHRFNDADVFPELAGLNLLYKAESSDEEPLSGTPQKEEGSFKDSYTTEFMTLAGDDFVGAEISHVDGTPSIDCSPNCYLVVKDGNHSPGRYLFNLALSPYEWDGVMMLKLSGFWQSGFLERFQSGQGSISHVAIYGVSPIPLPASVWLFGSALIGFIGYSRRRIV